MQPDFDPNAPERRFFDVEFRVAQDGDTPPVIEGYAAVFQKNSLPIAGMFIERIEPGAFRQALQGKPDVVALLNHDPSMLLGRSLSGTLRLAEDEHGLRVEIDPPDTQLGRDTLTLLKRRDLRSMSFAFNIADGGETWTEKKGMPLRTITKVERLFDVSVVASPAYPATSVHARALLESRGIKLTEDAELEGCAAPGERETSAETLAALVRRLRANPADITDPEQMRALLAELSEILPIESPPAPDEWAIAAAHRSRLLELAKLR